ncbi:putative myosin-7-like [Sesbania bispinosa]|nr:putative myosin-7-like [Sesbania bispinosa]
MEKSKDSMRIELEDGDACMEEEKIQIVEDSLNDVEFGHTCEENIDMVEDSLDDIEDNDACIEEENVETV